MIASIDGQSFATRHTATSQVFGKAAVGVDYRLSPNATVSLGYEGTWQQGNNNQGARLGVA